MAVAGEAAPVTQATALGNILPTQMLATGLMAVEMGQEVTMTLLMALQIEAAAAAALGALNTPHGTLVKAETARMELFMFGGNFNKGE